MRRPFSFANLTAALIPLVAASHMALATTEVGQKAPPLAATELDGSGFDLSALHGKVVIVNFWATWCQPCREEMPALNAFYRQHQGEGLDLIGISTDRPRDRDDVVKIMHAFAYPAAMLRDAKVNGFGPPEALPVTFVIDRDGVVRAKFRPDQMAVTEKALDDAVLPLIAHKSAE